MKTTSSLLAAGMFLADLANGFGQATFTKITSGDIVNDLGHFTTCAWGDFNNDGFLDLFVANWQNSSNVLYRNNGNGTFIKITQGDPIADADYHVSCAWGDYDNDGNLDLLVSAGAQAPTARHNLLYHNNGDGTFARVSGGSVTNQLGFFGACAWADYDNDGFLDLFVTNPSDSNRKAGKNLLFHNNGDGTFTKITSGAVANDITGGWCAQWADYDNDGFMDLFVSNNPPSPNSFNLLYHNDRNGTFTRVLTNVVATDQWPEGALCSAWGDYDNDGFQDLFVTSTGGGQNRLYRNSREGTFTKITSGPMLYPPIGGHSAGCAWGDFDNDGYLDLFVTNVDGKNALFHNIGNGTFTQVLSGDPVNDGGPGINSQICSWADYDNDGFLDLFVSSYPAPGGPGKNLLYHNDGNTNAWLEVKCVGTVANRSAIGTKVRVQATIGGKTFWQLREINNGGNWNAVPLVSHFGLGDATNSATLRVEWPSGTVQEFHNVAPKQILTVTEPPRLRAQNTEGLSVFSLKGGLGFHYSIEMSEDLRAWSVLSSLTLTNLNGTVAIMDNTAPTSAHRFYRAMQLEQ